MNEVLLRGLQHRISPQLFLPGEKCLIRVDPRPVEITAFDARQDLVRQVVWVPPSGMQGLQLPFSLRAHGQTSDQEKRLSGSSGAGSA